MQFCVWTFKLTLVSESLKYLRTHICVCAQLFSIQGGRLWLGPWLSLGRSGAQMCFPLLWCTTQFNYTFVRGVASFYNLTLLWLSLPLQESVMLGRMSAATTAILLFVRLTTTRRLTSSQWLLINLDFLSSRLLLVCYTFWPLFCLPLSECMGDMRKRRETFPLDPDQPCWQVSGWYY